MSFGLGRAAPAVNQEAIDSSTPWMAAADGDLNLLQSALNHLHLDVSAADENGYTLLQAAASYNHLQIMQWLLSQNVPINAVDNEGDSALHYAATTDAVRLLVDSGIDTSVRNREGKTALESKRDELTEAMEDEDYEEDDDEAQALKSIVSYLSGLESQQQ